MDDTGCIRPYQPEDWPAIEDIVKQIWDIGLSYLRERRYGFQVGGRSWHAHKTDDIRRELSAHPGCSFVTEVDGRVVGFCCLHLDPTTGIGEVGQNGVHPDYRGKGYGSRQLAFVLDELARRGMSIAEVQTGLNDGHAPARKMYERAGFQPLIGYQRYSLDLKARGESGP